MSDEFDVTSYPDEFVVVRVGDDFSVEQWPDEFIIHDNSDDWTIYTTTETEYTLEFESVGLNDAAIAIAARNAAIAAQVQADADVVLTHFDVTLTHADVTQTGLDKLATAADRVQTGLDRVATGNDVVLTHADVVLTHADVVLTHADVVLTHADKIGTAADRVQTGLDRVQTGLDRVQTGLDRVATGNDVATANALLAAFTGGLTGQILIKTSNANYAFGWQNPTGMLTAIYDPTNIAADVFARANHTGTQTAATISNFNTAADARVSAAIGVTVQAYSAILAATTASYTVALDTKLGGIATGADVTVSALPVAIHGATNKATPVDADELPIADSAAAFGLKRLTWANVKAGILAYWNGTAKAVPVDADRVWLGDSTTSNTPVYSTWTQVKAFLKTYFDTLYSTPASLAAYAFGVAAKTTLTGADTINITDSAASNVDKKITWTNMQEQIRLFFFGVGKAVPVDADVVATADSAASFAPKYSTWTQVKAFLKTYFDTIHGSLAAANTWTAQNNFTTASTYFVSFAGLTGFEAGTGDSASYTTYNTKLHGHFGLGMADFAGTINGYYDFRLGKWDVKDGYYINTVRIPFQKAYESAQQTITLGGALTLAHGLGVQPKAWQVFMQCTTAEQGYSIGNEISISPGVHSIVPDATNLNVRMGAAAAVISNKTTGVAANSTAANWKLVVRSWA